MLRRRGLIRPTTHALVDAHFDSTIQALTDALNRFGEGMTRGPCLVMGSNDAYRLNVVFPPLKRADVGPAKIAN